MKSPAKRMARTSLVRAEFERRNVMRRGTADHGHIDECYKLDAGKCRKYCNTLEKV
jgi:hypothetical protein